MAKLAELEYVQFLNDAGIPNEDLESEGGRIPDSAKYGTWLRRNDPIAFRLGCAEFQTALFKDGLKHTKGYENE